ncbi:15631_t:CDS:2 [Cetraspora pellucida]|uniref:15631_t:CDS:1 n=1 Tax=Cetraspora pellucida TaxID=1433469 RepID=A0A9N9DKU5_9GLOM|nr:15631_t:CDS:2 [Cetraspora pellucida]
MSTDHDAIASLCALRFFGANNQVPTFNVMDNFYAQLTPMKFPSAKEAASFCRQLAREYGFTVKQETSSNKNVYVYCSREGISESVKIGRETKRKRASLRCDCKWRVVLFRNEQENIPEPWPPNVLQRIADLANSGLSTGDIRNTMQMEFPNLLWDERRFYNRLAEERKKLKIRDTEQRVIDTIVLAARLASLACSNKEYTDKVHTVLHKAFEDICRSAKIDPSSVFSDGLSTYGDMTVITPSMSSSADIICTYPAGIITVKNIPGQKGRPSKKNLHQLPPNQSIPPQSQCQLDQIDNITPQNILTPPNEHSPQLTQQMNVSLHPQNMSSPQSHQNGPLSSQLQQQSGLHLQNNLAFPRLQNTKDLMLSQLNAQNVLMSPHIQNSSPLTPQTQSRIQILSQSYFHSQPQEAVAQGNQNPHSSQTLSSSQPQSQLIPQYFQYSRSRPPPQNISNGSPQQIHLQSQPDYSNQHIPQVDQSQTLSYSQQLQQPIPQVHLPQSLRMQSKISTFQFMNEDMPDQKQILSPQKSTIGLDNAPRIENTNTYDNVTSFTNINSRIETSAHYNPTGVNRIFTSEIQPSNLTPVNQINNTNSFNANNFNNSTIFQAVPERITSSLPSPPQPHEVSPPMNWINQHQSLQQQHAMAIYDDNMNIN